MAKLFQQRWWRETVGLARLRTPQRQPEARLPPGPQPCLPLRVFIRQLAEADPRSNESRLHAFCFLTYLFFSSCWWDTLIARVGHPPQSRQEAARNRVGIDATRAPLTRDDALCGQFGSDGG